MNDMSMDEVSHKVVRLEEKVAVHETNINRLESIAERLVETSQNQSHAVDKLIERHNDEKLGERVNTLETTMLQAKFAWKVMYGILTTPVLGYIGYKVFEFIQSIPR